jgi:hypothetical protein
MPYGDQQHACHRRGNSGDQKISTCSKRAVTALLQPGTCTEASAWPGYTQNQTDNALCHAVALSNSCQLGQLLTRQADGCLQVVRGTQ